MTARQRHLHIPRSGLGVRLDVEVAVMSREARNEACTKLARRESGSITQRNGSLLLMRSVETLHLSASPPKVAIFVLQQAYLYREMFFEAGS